MNATALSAFSSQAHASRQELFGVRLLFRGVQVTGRIFDGEATIDLETGGFSEKADYKITLPIEFVPAPKAKEAIYEVATGRTFYITSVQIANSDRLDLFEHRCTATLA